MRLGLAIAAVLRAVNPASQEEDKVRYVERVPVPAPMPAGPMLGWSNKRSYGGPGGPPGQFSRPEPLALAGQFIRGREAAAPGEDLQPPPGARRATYQAPPYQVFVPQVPYQPTRSAVPPPEPEITGPPAALASGPLPTSLYGGPTPAVVPPQQIAAATPRQQGEPSKLYSLHRSYGLEPDTIPETPAGNGYVFIGPPDAPKAAEDKGDDADEGLQGGPF